MRMLFLCEIEEGGRISRVGVMSVPAGASGVMVQHSIAASQWNCDMFSSRNPELEVWCKKNYFDVEIVQETQLWAEDIDVCVSGCGMVRLDR